MGVWEKAIRSRQSRAGILVLPLISWVTLSRCLSLSEPLCITCKKRVVIVPTLQICGK